MLITRTSSSQIRLAPKALIPVAVAALTLAGCGGGGETASTSATAPQNTITAPPQRPKPKESEKSGSTTQSRSATPISPNVPAPTDSNPLPNQGTKAPAPGVPTTKGGDNSIQTYGVEADSGDRLQAASTAKAYLDAQAASRWDAACSYLSDSILTELRLVAKKAPGSSGGDCADMLATLTSRAPQAALRSAAKIRVLSLRMKGGLAFMLYKDGRGALLELPMARQGGVWKVGGLAGSIVPL